MAKIEEGTFHLEIISTERLLFSGPAQRLHFTGIDGEYGILPHHEPMVTALLPCELRFKVDGKWHFAAASDGLVEVMPEKVTLLSDTVELPEEIDRLRAQAAKDRAKQRLSQPSGVLDRVRAKDTLARAQARLLVVRRINQGNVFEENAKNRR